MPRGGHGYKGSPTYYSWRAMKTRCLNPNHAYYWRYGGRGIVICERWKSNFMAFLGDMGERPSELTLERINNDGNYEPENCRWATRADQVENSIAPVWLEYNGLRLNILQWSRKVGISNSTLWRRLRKLNWTVEKVLTTPTRNWRGKIKTPMDIQ